MKILIDAMGGDNAPFEIVKGALAAREEFGVETALVGIEDAIRGALRQLGHDEPPAGVEIIHASEVVDMHDDPATATRTKKDSSMAVALRLLKEGGYDAAVSAGSTGALLTGATLITKRIRGIRRAALAPVLPVGEHGTLIIDSGASVDCTPEYLLQFAYMGSFYQQYVRGAQSPRVALLNVGTESSKGTELQKSTYALLQEAHEAGRLNFVGNVEAREAMSGSVDVIVCDGFSGNVLLKALEGAAIYIIGNVKELFYTNKRTKVAGALVKSYMGDFKRRMDMNEVGGTALLGISHPVIKAHGSSNARAIRSAIAQAISFVDADVIGKISDNIEYMRLDKSSESA